MICPNTNTIEWKSLVAKIGELQAWKEYIKNGNEIPTLGQLESINKELKVIQFQKLFPEEQFLTAKQLQQRTAIEQSVKDTAEKMSAKIGIPFRYIRETQTLAKGWIENGEAVINLAYATLDTPIHEILGHPIVRAIKNTERKDGTWGTGKVSDLYENLLKELETGKGKEVLDRVKRDYKYKDEKFVKHLKLRLENTTLTLEERNDYQKHIDSQIYSLEEQQEEAIVTLLGKLTEGKLDKVKDKNLISLLKELLSQMTAYMRSLFNSKELDISKLKADMTLDELSTLLAYSNSKIILPGSKVEYTTPDGTKHSTYQEASNYISKLFNESKDVDLSGVGINRGVTKISGIQVDEFVNNVGITFKKINGKWYTSYTNYKQEISGDIVLVEYNFKENKLEIESFIEKNKEYEQSKEIIEAWKKENGIVYNPEEVYSRGQGFYSSIGAYSTVELDLLLQNLLTHIEDNKKAGGEFTISAFTKPIDKRIGHLEKESSVRFVIYPKSKDIKWAAPTDVYSGSVWDASQKVSKDKKSELLGVSFTKAPSLQNVNQVSPNLADIIDNLAHHHNELGIELTGTNFRLEVDENVPYEIKKLVNSVNSILDSKYGKIVKPEIKESDKEIIKVELSDPYTTKFSDITFNTEQEAKNWIKIESEKQDKQYDEFDISSENKFTYKVVKIKQGIQPTKTKDNVSSIKSVANKLGGNPLSDFTITKEEYEKNIKSRTEEEFRGLTEDIEPFKEHAIFEGQQYRYFDENGRPYFRDAINNTYIRRGEPKEYTSQALTNLKIATLKEVAKKYPRSLITSKVIAVSNSNERQYSKIDLLESISELKDDVTLKEQLEIVDSLTSAVLVSYADVLGTKGQISIEQAVQQTIDGLPNLANEYSAEGNTVMANRITRLISRLNETTEFTGYKNLIKDRISALKYKVIEDPEFDDNLTSGEVYDKSNSERDPEDRMSAKTKRFLTFIPVIDDNGNSEANYLGLEKYYDFNDLYKGLLSNTSDKSAEDVMLTLKELSNNNNMYKSTLFKFNELPQDEKNSIISVLIKQSAKFKMLQFYPADAQGRVSIEVINSNRATAEDSLMEDWNNNFSTLVDKKIGNEPLFYKNTDESGFTYYNINQNAGKLLYVAFKTASDSYLANKATEEVKLKAIDTMVSLFNEIGIKVQPVTIYTILNKGKLGNIKGTPTELLRGKLAFIFEGLFTQLDSNGKVNVIKTADEDSNDIFKTENVTIKNLAISHNRIFNAKQTESFTNSEGNSTYPFIERHYLNAALAELKNTNSALYQALSKDNFTKDSLWLKNISNLDIFYTDGLKNAKKKNRFGKTYENLSDKERLLMRYALFQNQGKKETFFVYPTPSDKTTFPLISAIKVALNYNGSPSIDNINEESEAFKALLQLAFSELYRVKQTIAEIKVNKPEGKISGYHTQEKTGKRFFFFTGLNDIFASQIENEEDIFITDDNIKLITAEIKNHLNQLYDKEKAKLISEGILNEAFTKSSFDKSYITKIQEQKNENIKLITTEDTNKHAIIDYLVNDMIALGNIYQLFVGDPAQLTKSISDDKITKTENNFYEEFIKNGLSEVEAKEKAKVALQKWIIDNSIVNVFKRIAKDIAPGREGVFNTSHYNTIFIHEPISYSSLGDKYKEYAKKLDAADAQEWVTPEEYIDNLFAYGEVLSEDKYKTLKEKLKNQEEFTDEELGLVLQPTKPVYVWRQAKGQNDPLLMTYYIKTSAFPLLPQLVRGTQLENLYKIMKGNNIQRAVVKSGVKAGFSDGVRVFEENGKVVSKEKLQKYLDKHPNSIKSLDRKGFRIQQNVPYDENKNSILLGTQLAKLIFANLNSKWDFNGKTGAELKQEFDKLVSKLTDIKYNAFLEAYKITPTQNGFEIGDLDKFLESMKKLAIQKGFNYNDLLQLKTIVKNGKKVFEINPFFNTKYKEVESLFTSMVSNEIMKRKLPGRSYVQGSSVGFVSQREQGIESIEGKTKDELKSISGIVYTNDWKGDLDYRIDENGGIFAEILVPFNFFDNKGKKLDIKDYTNKDGTLDIKRFDPELLESIGYRIPTQGHMSMVKMKIVGFLPASSGDLMIVPAAITKQMGSDFDVDKVYNHTFNHELIGNTIKKIAYTEGSNNEEEVQNRIIEIFKQILENPKAAQLVAKTLSSDPLKDAVDEVRDMKGITAESHLGLLDRQFNDSQVSINRDGKVMIGISSLSSVHHALSQHANLYLAESEEFLPVMFADENGLVYTDVGGGNNVNDYTDYVGQPQVGAWRLDKIFGFSGIPILDTIAYIQTAATDNAKDPILGKGNINKHTANVALFIARSGFNDKWISNFLMQDSLITLSKRFDSQLDDITDMSYVANKRDVIVQELRDELQAQYVSLGGNAETAKMLHVFKLSELKALNEESANPGVKSRDYYLYQLQILANFEMWDKTSKELGKIQNALNFETKGLGKDLFGVTRKLQLLAQTDINTDWEQIKNLPIKSKKVPIFINADKLVKGTFIGNLLDKGVIFAETLFNNAELFPYKNPIINDIYKSIKENSNRKHLDVLSEEFADTINEHIRFSIFSKLAEKLDERSINDLRNSLLFGKEALGNQIIALKQELQDEPDSPGMNFLNKLSISKQKNSSDPILVEFPNSLKVSDTQSLLNSLGWLDLYNGPHTKEIAIQMVKYSFAIGNERSIHDFGRFLPYDMQKDLGIIDALNSVNYEMFGMMRDNFVTQFFQHSPEFAPQFKDEDVTVDVKDKNTFTLNAEVIKSYTASTDENNQPNTPIILTKFEQQEGRKKSKLNVYLRNGNTFTYTKIDTLGATGINEYDLMMSYGQSFLPQNQVKSRPVKQPVVKPVENMAKAEMPQLAAPKKELATTTQSSTSVETTQVNITGLLQSIAANGEYQGLAAYILENNKAFLPNIEIKYGKINNGSRGRTEYFNDKILITIDNTHPANLKEAGFREVLMHEVMHALTKAKVEQYYSGKLENLTEEDIKAIKQLEQVTRQIQYLYSNTPLYNVQLEMKVKNMSMSDSMARNVKELVAYSFTDKDIKAFLNGQKGLDQKKSLLERFKQIILKLLGLQNINEDSLLANTALAVFELQKNPLFSESTIVDNKEDNLPSQTYANDLDLFNRFIKGLMNQGVSMRIINGNIVIINNREREATGIYTKLNETFAQFGQIARFKNFYLPGRTEGRSLVKGLIIDPIVLKKYNDYITGLNTDFLVSNQLTKYEKTIEQLKSQIKILEKRKSEGKSDYYEINSKIDAIDAKIKAIEAKYNDQNLFKQAKSQISEVTQNIRAINLQLSEDMTSENVMKAMNILMESDNVIKGWLSIDEFMDYSTGTVEKKTWNSIKTLLTEQRKEYLDVLKRAYTKYNSEILKRSDSNSLFSSVTDISGMSKEMLDISTSDVSLLKSVHEAVNRSRREKDQELISAEKQIEDIFQRLETITGKKGLVASDVFLQKDSNGKWTGALVKEFLNEFYQKRNKLKAEAQESGEWGEYYAFINANTHTITQAEFESKSNSVFNTEDYQKQTDLLERYAKREKVEREKLESLKEQAQHELDGDQITQEEYNNKILELDKSIAIWVSTNSPYAYWAAKKAKRSTKGMYGFNYIFNKPISKWLDPSYTKIKSDPKLFGLYNEIKDFFYQNDKNVPNNLYGMLPELSKTFVEKMKEDGTMSLLSSTSDWMKNLYSEDIANSKESDIRIGNNVIKSIPVSMMGNHLAIEDKSRDLKAILKAHTATSLHYKHMSQVQPIASAAEQLLAEIKAIKKVGGKVLTDSSGNPIELVGGLLNARAQLEYYIDTVIYKRSKLQEAVSNKKTYSTKDKELIKELDKQLKEGKITQEEYDISNEKLGQNITGSKIGDTVITYTFLKALGLNVVSPIVNGTFALISNFTHSAGKVDFDTPSAMRALKVILSSLTQSVTFDALKSKDAEKLYAFSSRLGIMHDVSEGTVAKNLVDKVMKMQSKSEFAGVAQSMTATLMYQKLKDKNGKDVSVWDAYKVVNDELVWDTDKMGAYIEPAINELFSKERKGVNMYKMHARVTQMNKFLHGNYRDPMKLKKTITGRAVSLFRTWLPMSVAERFGKEYFDDSLGRIKKGRYRSVATAFNQDGLIKTLTRIVKGQLFLNNTEGLEDVDVENIRKVNAELRSIMFLSAIAIMLKAIAGDDDDDKTSLYMALNVINRTYADITFFTNPNSANQIFKNAIPAFKTITDFTDIFLAVPGLIDGTDTYKTGHRKGKSKMGKEIIENIMIVNQWDKIKSSGSYLYENMR